jgi:hypothetical protein
MTGTTTVAPFASLLRALCVKAFVVAVVFLSVIPEGNLLFVSGVSQ